jgi:hypothetical protein
MAEYTNTALSTDYDKLPLKVIIHPSLLLINKQSKHARNVLSKQEAQAWLAKGRMKRKEEKTGSSLLTKSYTYINIFLLHQQFIRQQKTKTKQHVIVLIHSGHGHQDQTVWNSHA